MSHSISDILDLLKAGFTREEIIAAAGDAPVQASAPVKAAKTPKGSKPKGNAFYQSVIASRVPCAHGVAKCGFFAANGRGKTAHTTCPKGRKALAALR